MVFRMDIRLPFGARFVPGKCFMRNFRPTAQRFAESAQKRQTQQEHCTRTKPIVCNGNEVRYD